MNHSRLVAAVLCLLMVASITIARADVVELKNGDRMSGEIVKMEEESLTLKTTYGGEVKIDRKEIQGLTSTGPQTLRLKDGSILRGVITSPAPDQVTVTSAVFGATTNIPLGTIETINAPHRRLPGISESGRGSDQRQQ